MMNFGYNARKVKFPNDEKIVVHFDTQDPWQQPASGECLQLVLLAHSRRLPSESFVGRAGYCGVERLAAACIGRGPLLEVYRH